MPQILFVCTGNICRSPMAEVLLRQRLQRGGRKDWGVASAGTWTAGGTPASLYAIQLMAERGLNLGSHRSREVDRHLLDAADLVLVMTQNHAESLRLEFPMHADSVFLLSEMKDGSHHDVEDPYGGSLEQYQVCVDELTDLISEGFERIIALAEGGAR